MLEVCLHKDMIEAGCDEAGRGCLAGPVFAAAVILPNDFNEPLINDSKLLTHKQREKLREVIEHYAVDWAVAMVSNQEIDEINILNASILAMHRAIESLKKKRPQHLLIDGNRFKPYSDIPHTCIVKGDSKFLPIAAASILAKTHRDEFMTRISKEYPYYQWEVNKGYPTKKHREGIAKNGISPYHRKSFKLL
ncbi:ribonuclease HII [Tenuifilum thalassicum]|uniref:Ribonuclease HII n=1 Tax=Tenuifilum thalassicum TaxID=2590900 RepID=A0A7D4C299_9BACT|nr:ribonuclease HII [Tenuifilum thalassicum]QKG81264.1 ribonuclease HII [Tenuifilum thalassicum]